MKVRRIAQASLSFLPRHGANEKQNRELPTKHKHQNAKVQQNQRRSRQRTSVVRVLLPSLLMIWAMINHEDGSKTM